MGYLCMYIFPTLIAFLWQIETPFIRDYFALSQSPKSLLSQPWTLVTYSFFHTGFGHWFFNMIMLYFGGVLFMNLSSPRRFLGVYFLGIIIGGLFFVLTYQVFPVFSHREGDFLLGASAGIMAVMIFLASYIPSYRIYLLGVFSLPLWVLGALLIIVDLISIPVANAGGHIAHLGGASIGGLYALYLKRGFRLSFSFNKKKKETNKYPNKATEERINTILDKIAKSGYDSLTREEKNYLFLASKNDS